MAERLSADGHEVAFVGTPQGLEARLVPEAGVDFHALPAKGFDRSRPWTLLAAVAVLLASTVRAWLLLGSARPDVVIGFGGYVSLPVGFAAVLRGVPLVLHEQNSVPGMANKALSRWARAVGVTYESSRAWLTRARSVVLTGNPVRPAVVSASRGPSREILGLPADAPVLLVFGGSRGAKHLNEATIDLYSSLSTIPDLHVIHASGPKDFEACKERLARAESAAPGAVAEWRLLDYLTDMPSGLAAADVIVSRAGATSIAEITALGRAAVLVPYPYATDDHQTLNARTVADAGACIMVPDAQLDSSVFADAVMRLLTDEGERQRMTAASATLGRPDAAARVESMALAAAGADPGEGRKDPR